MLKLERPRFGADVPTKKALMAFGPQDVLLPAFDLPISPKENFYRAARRDHPCWVPFPAADMQQAVPLKSINTKDTPFGE